jgi:hypothetical protein
MSMQTVACHFGHKHAFGFRQLPSRPDFMVQY